MRCIECKAEIMAQDDNCPECGRKLGDPKISITLTGSLSVGYMELPPKIENAIKKLINKGDKNG